MMKIAKSHGFTLLEAILATALTAAALLVIVKMVSPVTRFFRASQGRQMANFEARTCMDTIQRVMSNGRISTLAITTPSTVPLMPFSEAQFNTVDGSSYTIMWSTAPMNSVHLERVNSAGSFTDTILSAHATALNFTLDLDDPAKVFITLQ